MSEVQVTRQEVERLRAEINRLKDGADWRVLTVELSGKLNVAERRLATAKDLLRRIRSWDQLPTTADGAFWKREIDAFLAGEQTGE